ncbi:MAG: recombination protein RecA, partial [Thermosipho sp. (in: thermotogales)]|nr:recombination protein RecA [Thermosipho sp. (in: thermotogales)]
MAKNDSRDTNKEELLEKLVKELEKNHGTGSVMLMGKGLDNSNLAVV